VACAPHRFIANDRNVLLDAVLTPSSVLPIEDHVMALPVAREGTAQLRLTGGYTGVEEKLIDVEITDVIPADPIVSAPVFSGAGSSLLVDVEAVGLPSQVITIQLMDAGSPATYASVSFEGQRLRARAIGAAGNGISITIDQTEVVVATEAVAALIQDLKAGTGGPTSGIEGTGLDFDAKVIGSVDNVIPANAHRLVFGQDTAAIYTQYKAYTDNKWLFHFVPELKRDIPKGVPVYYVTGGRTVTITDGVDTEVFEDIVTVYDLFSRLRNESQLIDVDGVVANDRTPTGQAVRELLVRTDAHVLPSTGTGSEFAKQGFIDTFANANAVTDMIEAVCFAADSGDHPNAKLGGEYWDVRSALFGRLGTAITNVPFVDTSGRWGFTIKQQLPPGYGVQNGGFTWVEDRPAARAEGDPLMPPHCDKNMKLGSEAVDQIITLKWTQRPPDDCDCDSMPAPPIGGACLGVIDTEQEGGGVYSEANRARLTDLYDWLADATRDGSQIVSLSETTVAGLAGIAVQQPFIGQSRWSNLYGAAAGDDPMISWGFVAESLAEVVDYARQCLKAINDELTEGESPDVRGDSEAAWDAAIVELKADVDALLGSSPLEPLSMSFRSDIYITRLDSAMLAGGLDPLGKADASSPDESGDGCWRDYGGDYFTVEGSVRGGYGHLTPNKPYYSVRRASNADKYFSTREFGLALMIDPACLSRLKYGDEIVFRIGGAGWPATYQPGDRMVLSVVAAGALQLTGGKNDNSTQTWSVTGSDFGPFPPWVFIPGTTGTAYSEDGLSFDIERRGIPNQKGDKWVLSISGGHARYRVDGGMWSSPFGITAGAAAFIDGLSMEWIAGADPPFVVGDLYSFRALQPHAVSHVRTGLPERWKWSGAAPMLDIDPGEEVELDGFMLWHSLPTGATILLRGGSTGAVSDWSEPIEYRPFLTVQPLSTTRTAQYLRLEITGGDGGSIFWQWGGMMLATTWPADINPKPRVRAVRGNAALSQGGSKLASARGTTVDFPPDHVTPDDMVGLLSMFEWTKGATGDDEIEPIVVVPNINRPEDAVIGEIDQDELVFDEYTGQQATDGDLRRYGGGFSISGIWQPRA
jgi:hypothetical protein